MWAIACMISASHRFDVKWFLKHCARNYILRLLSGGRYYKTIEPLLVCFSDTGGQQAAAQSSSDNDPEPAHAVAEKVFRDLICRAAFNNLKSVLHPVLS